MTADTLTERQTVLDTAFRNDLTIEMIRREDGEDLLIKATPAKGRFRRHDDPQLWYVWEEYDGRTSVHDDRWLLARWDGYRASS